MNSLRWCKCHFFSASDSTHISIDRYVHFFFRYLTPNEKLFRLWITTEVVSLITFIPMSKPPIRGSFVHVVVFSCFFRKIYKRHRHQKAGSSISDFCSILWLHIFRVLITWLRLIWTQIWTLIEKLLLYNCSDKIVHVKNHVFYITI